MGAQRDTDAEVLLLRRDVDTLKDEFRIHREESNAARAELHEDVKLLLSGMSGLKNDTQAMVATWQAAGVAGKIIKWIGVVMAPIIAVMLGMWDYWHRT